MRDESVEVSALSCMSRASLPISSSAQTNSMKNYKTIVQMISVVQASRFSAWRHLQFIETLHTTERQSLTNFSPNKEPFSEINNLLSLFNKQIQSKRSSSKQKLIYSRWRNKCRCWNGDCLPVSKRVPLIDEKKAHLHVEFFSKKMRKVVYYRVTLPFHSSTICSTYQRILFSTNHSLLCFIWDLQ